MKSVGLSFFAHLALAFGFVVVNVSAAADSSSESMDIGNFLWFSDVHLDDYYGTANAEVHKAGAPCANASAPYYSAYGCGSSLGLLKSTLDSASRAITEEGGIPKPDFIMFTGDSTRHNSQNVRIDGYNSSEASISYVVNKAMTTVYDGISERFPDVPVIELPSLDLGNNDFLGDYKLNVTSYLPCLITEDDDDDDAPALPNATNQWLIDVADRFQNLFVDDEESSVFACGGYFNRRLREGLRLISLNTVVWCLSHTPNVDGTSDPFGEHAWLRVQLKKAKKQGEKVYITGHVPPMLQSFVNGIGNPLWQDEHVVEFFETVNKYQDVVAGIFFAHVHSNELRVMPDMPDNFPPMLITGSISPCYTTTPFYSFVFYDRGETKFPVDVVTYNLNLDAVQNETTMPVDDESNFDPWERMFQNLTSFLGISSLTNRETLLLAERLASNASDDGSVTFEKYFQTWYKVSTTKHHSQYQHYKPQSLYLTKAIYCSLFLSLSHRAYRKYATITVEKRKLV